MPTGYTQIIEEGETSFSKFALRCARAFGVCSEMRDDGLDKPIPEKFTVSDYHSNEINRIEKNMKKIDKMADKDIKEIINKEYKESIEIKEKAIRDINKKTELYNKMLAKIQAWQPPTEDHENLKRFMIEQICVSTKFDGVSYWKNLKNQKLIPKKWRAEKQKRLIEDLEYHKKELDKEINIVNERNIWIKQLRDSLVGYD